MTTLALFTESPGSTATITYGSEPTSAPPSAAAPASAAVGGKGFGSTLIAPGACGRAQTGQVVSAGTSEPTLFSATPPSFVCESPRMYRDGSA